MLVRATNGKSRPRRDEKVKISTVVQPKDLAAFFGRLADTSKAGMSALKRKKKKVRKNDKKQKKAPKTS